VYVLTDTFSFKYSVNTWEIS